ncbi:hypothetical protein MFUR16E_11190 [Methylobacterium fujisawaense]
MPARRAVRGRAVRGRRRAPGQRPRRSSETLRGRPVQAGLPHPYESTPARAPAAQVRQVTSRATSRAK